MIKVYVMSTCGDCRIVKEKLSDNPEYELIDIGEHVRNLKQFLALRDNHPAFDAVKRKGTVGLPCFVLEDGSITFSAKKMGLIEDEIKQAPSCSIDGSGC